MRRLFRVWVPAVVAGFLWVLVTSRGLPWADLWRLLTIEPQATTGGPYYGCGVYFITWTIAHELCFYAIFALAMACSHRHRAPVAVLLLIGLGGGLQVLLTGSWSGDPYAMDPSAGTFLPPTLLKALLLVMNPLSWMFAIGIVFFMLWSWLQRTLARFDDGWLWFLFAFPVILFMYGYFTGARGHGLFNIGWFAVAAFFAFLVLQTLLGRGGEGGRRAPRALMWLGTVSYSM